MMGRKKNKIKSYEEINREIEKRSGRQQLTSHINQGCEFHFLTPAFYNYLESAIHYVFKSEPSVLVNTNRAFDLLFVFPSPVFTSSVLLTVSKLDVAFPRSPVTSPLSCPSILLFIRINSTCFRVF